MKTMVVNAKELREFVDVMSSRCPGVEITKDNLNDGLTGFIVGFVETTEGNKNVERYNKIGKKILKDEKDFGVELFNTKLKFFSITLNLARSMYGARTVDSLLKR